MKIFSNKHILQCVLLFILSALFLASCNENADHPISGHTYEYNLDFKTYGVWHHSQTKVTFHRSGKCTHYYYDSDKSPEYQSDTETHLKWDIEGNSVIIRHDNSTYWKKSARNTEWIRFTYNASNNTLSESGKVYTCVK